MHYCKTETTNVYKCRCIGIVYTTNCTVWLCNIIIHQPNPLLYTTAAGRMLLITLEQFIEARGEVAVRTRTVAGSNHNLYFIDKNLGHGRFVLRGSSRCLEKEATAPHPGMTETYGCPLEILPNTQDVSHNLQYRPPINDGLCCRGLTK